MDTYTVVHSMAHAAPWVGPYARLISWFSMGVVFLTALSIPPILMAKDGRDGGPRMSTLGFLAWCAILLFSVSDLLLFGLFGGH